MECHKAECSRRAVAFLTAELKVNNKYTQMKRYRFRIRRT